MFFISVIYWTQKVHNDFIFLSSLHSVPHKCSSGSEVHEYFYKKIILAERGATPAPPAAPLRRTWNPCHQSPLWPVLRHECHCGARSGEYGGCGRHSKDRSWIAETVKRAVWGRTLSCWSKTPVLRRPRRLDLIAGRRWFFRRSAYGALVTVLPLGM